jgi:hypothetical protein
MVDAVNPANVWPPFGAFSMAVIQGEGQIVHLKGQVSLDAGDIRKEFFTAPFPVTTAVQIERLYHPDLMVEIAATAEIPRDRFHRPEACLYRRIGMLFPPGGASAPALEAWVALARNHVQRSSPRASKD